MKILALIFSVLLLSCGKKDIAYNYPDNPDYQRNSRAGTAFSKGDLVIYGNKKDGAKSVDANKNGAKYSEKSAIEKSALWQSSVEVIAALFPIAILNSNSGIITSEWYQDEPNSKERIKINAIISGTEAKKENLLITIFRQKKSDKTWQDSGRENSDSGGFSAKILQEKILEKAKNK